jgi:cytochrome c551/c552
MSRAFTTIVTIGTALSGLLAAGAPSATSAAERSGCVTCHLDEAMLVRNLAVSKVVKSALQSGAG